MGQTAQQYMNDFMHDAAEKAQAQGAAYMQSCQRLTKALEDMTRAQMSFSQDFAEKQAQFVNDALAVKDVQELTQKQNALAQENTAALLAQMSDNATRCLKYAEDVAASLMTPEKG